MKAVIFDVDGTLADSKAVGDAVGLPGGGSAEEAPRGAGAAAVYGDASDLLDRYEESPPAKDSSGAARGQRA